MRVAERNFNISRGEVWQRLLIPKDKRTRRKRVPVAAAASVLINEVKYVLPVEVTSEGGVLLSLTAGNTEWFAVGEYPWDMVLTVSRSALLTSSPLAETLGVKGTLTVTDYDNITPMESDDAPVPLEVVT